MPCMHHWLNALVVSLQKKLQLHDGRNKSRFARSANGSDCLVAIQCF